MKVLSVIISLIISVPSLSQLAGIRGSKHDFSGSGWTDGEICIACHVPHGASSNVDAPLWDRSNSTQTFIPYTSVTMKAAVGQPDGNSKLCLSCHDGTVAMDSFNGLMGSVFIQNPIGPNLLNGDGHWPHPVSIVYDSNLSAVDTRINDPSGTFTALGNTIQQDLLKNDKLQCSSCHDVHNAKGLPTLLKITENQLCITCHK